MPDCVSKKSRGKDEDEDVSSVTRIEGMGVSEIDMYCW